MRSRGTLALLLCLALLGNAAFESSAEAEPAHLTGRIVSAMTGEPASGVPLSWGGSRDTTDERGNFRLDLPSRTDSSLLYVQGSGFGFCDYRAEVSADQFPLQVTLIPNERLDTSRYSSFLSFFRSITATGRPRELLAADVTLVEQRSFHGVRLIRWHTLPLDVSWQPIAPGGKHEREIFRQAMSNWEEMTGLDLFRERSEAMVGLRVTFVPGGSWIRFSSSGAGGDLPYVRLNVDPEGADDLVLSRAEHELGHALFLLGHSTDPGHVMYGGGVSGQRVGRDEARVVRVMYGLPPGEDMERHLWPPDEEASMDEGSDRAVFVAAGLLMIMILLAMEASTE